MICFLSPIQKRIFPSGWEILRQQKNLRVEGLDISEERLAAYRAKLNLASDEIQQRATVHYGDMSNYHLEHKGLFDLIFVPLNSLGHLLEMKQHLDAFRLAYEHLAPGGRFVVDVFVPGQHRFDESALALGQVCDIPDEDCRLVVCSTRQYHRYTQTSTMQGIYERFFTSTGNERYFSQFSAHHFYPNELQLLFLMSGFSIEAIYGDCSWIPFGEGIRQIVIGRKPPA